MGAPKIDKYPFHILSLTQIKVDHSIQSRVETSKEYEREFAEAMLRGDQFPAITVFFDGRYYWLADGFHRFGATKQASRVNPKLSGIRAEVRNGTRRDAVVFSAGANIKFSIPRTRNDIRKAVRMLLADDEWFAKSNSVIAKHVGTRSPAIAKYRGEYCAETGKAIPEVVTTSNGRQFKADRSSSPKVTEYKGRRGKPAFRVCINGKQRYLGTNKDEAERRAEEIRSQEANPASTASVEQLRQMTQDKIVRRGFVCGYPNLGRRLSLLGLCGDGWVASFVESEEPKDLQLAIGRAMLLAVAFAGTTRQCVISGFAAKHDKLIALGEKLGVEFLTPDELVASLKGEHGDEGTEQAR